VCEFGGKGVRCITMIIFAPYEPATLSMVCLPKRNYVGSREIKIAHVESSSVAKNTVSAFVWVAVFLCYVNNF
jgi:hypothetical protein